MGAFEISLRVLPDAYGYSARVSVAPPIAPLVKKLNMSQNSEVIAG